MSNFAKVYEKTNTDQFNRIYFGLTMEEVKAKIQIKVRSEMGYSYDTHNLNSMHSFTCFSDFNIEYIEGRLQEINIHSA